MSGCVSNINTHRWNPNSTVWLLCAQQSGHNYPPVSWKAKVLNWPNSVILAEFSGQSLCRNVLSLYLLCLLMGCLFSGCWCEVWPVAVLKAASGMKDAAQADKLRHLTDSTALLSAPEPGADAPRSVSLESAAPVTGISCTFRVCYCTESTLFE